MLKNLQTLLVMVTALLVLGATPAYGANYEGTFTAPTYHYNTQTHVLSFTTEYLNPAYTDNIVSIGIGNNTTWVGQQLFRYSYSTIPYSTNVSDELDLDGGSSPASNVYLWIVINYNGDTYGYTSQSVPYSTLIGDPQIGVDPSTGSVTEGTPFTVDIVVYGAATPFNAAQAHLSFDKLSVNNLFLHPSSNACDFHYTQTPSISNPSLQPRPQ